MSGNIQKPVFMPLKKEWFEAFARGEKTEEWRLPGRLYNERTCTPGREIILNLGYKAKTIPGVRLRARIARVEFRKPSRETADALGAADGVDCMVLCLTDIRPEAAASV
jgi:hypothetical protein